MRAYERLLNYVKVYTTSDPVSDTHPTTARQFDLARMLVKELQDLGLADAHVDEHCYVYATLPATPGHEAAKGLGFIAHMDTSPDAPGENVKPQIHENYDGGDVVLPGTGAVLSTRQFPFLAKLKDQTLITTDGTTLLGADDKAGVAEIMTMLEILQKENRPHGIRVGGGGHRLLVLVEVSQLDPDVAERAGIHAVANHHACIECLAFQREFLFDDDLDFRAIGILRPRQQGPRCKP